MSETFTRRCGDWDGACSSGWRKHWNTWPAEEGCRRCRPRSGWVCCGKVLGQ